MNMVFRHVHKRPLQRLVRRRRHERAQVRANRTQAGVRNMSVDAEPSKPSQLVQIGEVSGIAVPAVWLTPSLEARVGEHHRSWLSYNREPLTNTPFYGGREAANG